jgi:hypothetical protein
VVRCGLMHNPHDLIALCLSVSLSLSLSLSFRFICNCWSRSEAISCNHHWDMEVRSTVLLKMAYCMKRLSDTHGCGFLAINQLSGSVPALGLLWSNCVNTRFMLERKSSSDPGRKLKLIFSPVLPLSCAHLIISHEGVKGVFYNESC